MTLLVEGFGRDAISLARLLAREGHTVRLASAAHEPGEAAALGELGIHVEPHADLDTDPGPAEIAYLDVWTPEVAPRVQRLRAQGTASRASATCCSSAGLARASASGCLPPGVSLRVSPSGCLPEGDTLRVNFVTSCPYWQ